MRYGHVLPLRGTLRKPQNLPEPLKQHSDGDELWQKIGLDFFEIAGKHYLAVVDYYSNFIEIDLMTTMTSAHTVTSLKKHCARYGIPRMIVSDRGPQFTSQEFKLLVDNWGITHIIEQRNTPRQDTGRSPAEMMFNRRTRSFLPGMGNSQKDTPVKEKREARRRSVKKTHDRKSRKLSEIDVGQSVFFQHTEGQNWKLGKVTDILGPNTYQVSGPNGETFRRNRVHMRPT